MTAQNRHPRNERGQTMVEFTLVAPILLVIVFAVIQFGIAFNNYLTLTDAVRAGARKAAVSRHELDPVAAVEDKVRLAAEDLEDVDLTVDVAAPDGWERGTDVTVEATYPYTINLLGFRVASGRLTSTTTERVE